MWAACQLEILGIAYIIRFRNSRPTLVLTTGALANLARRQRHNGGFKWSSRMDQPRLSGLAAANVRGSEGATRRVAIGQDESLSV